MVTTNPTEKQQAGRKLWRTTIVIWSDFDPNDYELDDLAREAVRGDAYCSASESILVDDPESDPNPPAMDFFGGDDNE